MCKPFCAIAFQDGFRIDPDDYPVLNVTMAPITLPASGADLLDSDRNDSCFYLIVSFDTKRQDIGGYRIPQSIGYVWANYEWAQPVGKDPDYKDFLRYIPIGWGAQALGEIRPVQRRISGDFLTAFPEHDHVPGVIDAFLKIDSNTLGGDAESILERVWFQPDRYWTTSPERLGH